MKKLIKSYSFWTALAGAVGLLVVSIGKIFGIQIAATGVEETIMALCGVLVVFGVVKKPKDNSKQTSQEDASQCKEQSDEDKTIK
ncbi:MAG: hypothetical protein IJ318_01995 [Clostridia bacterium]|nr:hypothetical protein [Clostridia bacterium]